MTYLNGYTIKPLTIQTTKNSTNSIRIIRRSSRIWKCFKTWVYGSLLLSEKTTKPCNLHFPFSFVFLNLTACWSGRISFHHFPRQSWCFMALTIFVTYVFSQVIRLHLQFLSFTETKGIIVLRSEAHDLEARNSQLFSWNKAGDFRTPTEFYAQIWTKTRSKQHARENARTT